MLQPQDYSTAPALNRDSNWIRTRQALQQPTSDKPQSIHLCGQVRSEQIQDRTRPGSCWDLSQAPFSAKVQQRQNPFSEYPLPPAKSPEVSRLSALYNAE